MKVVGIIAEYNPFHNGHAYQIAKIKEELQADYIVIAMSGNFVQRGTLSITDKYSRADMALSCGADVVFELPTLWSTASAEYFAKAGVSLFKNTKTIDTLCFGAECEDLNALSSIANLLSTEDETYRNALSAFLSNGDSFPRARAKALKQCLSLEGLDEILSHPNNILAIEYLKALKDSSISPYIIRRNGDDYHSKETSSLNASATAIRESLKANKINEIASFLPKEAHKILKENFENHQILFDDDISQILGYALLTKQNELENYADCNRELSDKIKKCLNSYKNFHSFCETLKTKEVTYSRIRRALLHIVLGHTKQDYETYKQLEFVPYLRLLGFKKEATEVLSSIKENTTIPIISKVANASELLDKEAYALFEKDLFAAELYNQFMYTKNNISIQNDYVHPLIIK